MPTAVWTCSTRVRRSHSTTRRNDRSGRFRDRLDAPEQKYIARNAEKQIRGRRCKSPGEGVGGRGDIAGDDRCSDRRNLISEVDDAAYLSDALAGSDQRWDGPRHWRGYREPGK